MATYGSKRWYAPVDVGYLVAFTRLTLALQTGMGLGVAHGIRAALGVALTTVASRLLFKEPLNRIMAVGIVLIMGGVLLVDARRAR